MIPGTPDTPQRCPGSGYYPRPAARTWDGRAECEKCGQALELTKARKLPAHTR